MLQTRGTEYGEGVSDTEISGKGVWGKKIKRRKKPSALKERGPGGCRRGPTKRKQHKTCF